MSEDLNRSKQEDIYNRLLKIIRSHNQPLDRLPPEETLAAELGISRVKLRDILAVLEARGYINRKKGIGTIVNRCLLKETVRLDIDAVYEENIAEAGYRPRTLVKKLQYLPGTPEDIAGLLEIQPADATYLVEKVIFADEKPAIMLQDYVLPQYYNQANIDMRVLAKSTFRFVQDYSKDILESIVVHIDACGIQGEQAEEMQVQPGTPILRLDSVCYSFKSQPIMCSVEFHNTKILPYSLFKRLHRVQYYSQQ
ncbi:MAG: GntR family transcriptional regulator [Oscillospiraceae bacterium]|nr:GntR family transcriptional regulator [Oscillospiraceae bacterium]